MPTEQQQQIDPALIDQTRREIGKLVTEIEALANEDINEVEFHGEYLRRVATALAAQAVAFWGKTAQGSLRLQYHVNLPSIGLEAAPSVQETHDALLRHCVREGKPTLFPPHSGGGDDANGTTVSNPTDYLIVLAPIMLEGQAIGLLEVFQDGSRRSSAQEGYLRFLARIADEAAKYYKNRRLRQFQNQQDLWNQLTAFIRTVHAGLDPKQVAYLMANEGKKLIQCERVSVAMRRGRKTVIEAISGQDIVEKRSNLVHRMSQLVDRVLAHGENLLYNGSMESHWPRDVAIALERYLEESGSKLVAVVPMTDTREFGVRGRGSAALIVEMVEDATVPEDMGGRIEAISRHGSVALYNALQYHRIPFLWFWQMMGSAAQWFYGDNLSKFVLATILVIALGVGLVLVPWPLKLEGRGELVPLTRRKVYAPITGLVRSVKVDHGDQTDEGSLLAEMSSPELDRELMRLQGELRAGEQTLRGLEAERQEKGAFDPEIGGKINQQKQANDSSRQQIQLQRAQMETLRVLSPIRGKVMDWKPKEKLSLRPVQQGDDLLEIAEVDGKWILEVELPENVVTHIAQARQEAKDGKLPVTFVLSASPEKTYHGTLFELATQAQPVEEENVISAKIELDPNEDIAKRVAAGEMVSGVQVRAKVNCGSYPVGYVLFRELIDFVREYVFF